MCGDASVPCLASPVLLLIIRNPACGQPVCPWGRVCPLSCLSRPLINNKKPCLRPACLSVGDASVPRLASLVLLSIRRSPPCGGPILAGRVRPLSCFLRLLIKALLGGNASVPCLAPLVLLLFKKEPTCDRPSCVRGDASVPCLASPVLLLIIKKPACGRPVCPWGRVCPLSCLSRPLINNKKPCLRPACLSVGDASVPRLASLVLLSIRRSPPCGGPILAGRVRPLSCFLRLLIKALLGGNASVPWLAFSSFCS